MADRIKGITVEIGGDTQGLDKALKGVNNTSRQLQTELRDVSRLLKFDPNNTELMAQKQKLLNKQIENSTKKLKTLKDAEAEVQKQFEKGEIKEEQYRAFQRELQDTAQHVRHVKRQLADLQDEQQETEQSTKQLDNLFKATNSTLDDYADTLGNKLVRSIKEGTASSRELKKAFDIVGRAAIGADADIDKVRQSINKLESGEQSVKAVRKELKQLSVDAQAAEENVNGLGDSLGNLAAGAAAGLGIDAAVEKSLDFTTLQAKIDIGFDVPDESKTVIRDAIFAIEAYGVDSESALEGVRRQWALNAKASDTSNEIVIKGAAAITAAYNGIDFIELIQETNEVAENLGITNKQALAMTNSLLKMGFPPEQLDIIGEYGSQLSRAGYTAQEIQGIFAAGIKTKTWNIDVLLDGLKEGRIKLAEMGSGVDEATADIIAGTNISAEQVQKWGAAIAAGGEGGKAALMDVALALTQVDDEVQRNNIGTAFFGTLWEEQGSKITDTILNASGHVGDFAKNQQIMNDTIQKIDETPQVQLNQAIKDMGVALEPILISVADVVSKIATWMSENPQLASTIIAIVGALGIFMGIVVALLPVILGLVTTATTLTVSIGAIASPILIVVGIIAALIAIGVALWLNWDKISAKAKELGKWVAEEFRKLSKAVKEKMDEVITNVKEIWGKVMTFFKEIDLMQVGKDIIQGLINGIKSMGKAVANAAKDIANGIGEKVSAILKLGSPSKLLMEMGQDTGIGLAIGIKKSVGKIKAMASDMANAAIPKEINAAGLNVKGSSFAAGSNAAGGMVVNIHSPKALDARESSRVWNRTMKKMQLQW
jgi:phage-related minor tail protein